MFALKKVSRWWLRDGKPYGDINRVVADQDPRYDAFLTPGSGSGSDPTRKLRNIFSVKNT